MRTFLSAYTTVKCLPEQPIIITRDVKEYLSKETGRDRINRMYSTNEFGFSPEIQYVITTGTTMAVLAGFVGGMSEMKKEKEDYLRKNLSSTYESQHLARRSLTDRMTLAGFRGALKTGVKYGSFSALYLLSTSTVANYRNKVSVWEHAGSAAVLGGLTRINFGIKGILAAGTLGGILGCS